MTRWWWPFEGRPEVAGPVARRLALAGCVALLGAGSLACGTVGPSAPHPSLARGPRAGSSKSRAEYPQPQEMRSTVPAAAESDTDRDGVLDADDATPTGTAIGGMNAKEPAPEPPADKPAKVAQNVPSPTTPASPGQQPPPAPGKPAPRQDTEPAAELSRSLIIYTARVTLAVYQVDAGLAAVERIAKESGGYLALRRDREITIRVPRARFEGALAAVDKIGDVLHRDIEAQDVTDEYTDLEIRIKNSRAMQKRLQQLLERAAVKEAIAIERELHRVTEELERMEGKLKLLKDKVAFSTITVAFEARGSSVAASRVRLPFPWLTQLGLPNLLNLHEER
jgi:hypothetical protein